MAQLDRQTTSTLYEKMVAAIDDAATNKNIYLVPKAAEQEGMSGGELRAGLSQRWAYSYADDAGSTVEVECYWYDQSKAFSIRPDMHVMKATLHDGEGSRSHVRKYEE